MIAADFARDGFAALPLLDPATVRAAQADIVEHIDRIGHALYAPFACFAPDTPLAARLGQMRAMDAGLAHLMRQAICTDAHRGPRLSALATAPALWETAQTLADRPLGEPVVRVRAAIPGFPESFHDWHSDVAIDDGTDCARVAITAWIPLSDTGPEAGGLELVAGRRTEPLLHERERSYHIPDAALADLPRARPTCPVGTVLFLDRFTPHRTLPPGADARFALVVWMKSC